jgi:hypothetical protein
MAAESPAPAATAAEVAAPKIDYAQLKAAVFELAGKRPSKAAEIAAAFGVKTFKDLGPEKWGDALAEVTAALTATTAGNEDFE